MTTQESISRAFGALAALWQGANGDRLRALFADGFTFHNLEGEHEVTNLADLRRRLAALHGAHPGAHLSIDGSVGVGSHVALEWSVRERRNGRPRGLADAAERAIVSGTCMVRLAGDRIAEIWELKGALAA